MFCHRFILIYDKTVVGELKLGMHNILADISIQ